MELAIDILNKEIERREISLAVESNVLIQNDMHNEIGGLKDVVEKLTTHDDTPRNRFEKLPLHWKLIHHMIVGIIIGYLMHYI
jgi:CDP-diacylglycerol pyrophosphatase